MLKLRRRLQQAYVPRVAATDMSRDVLLAADRITDRRGADRGADVEVPQWLQLLVVERGEGSIEGPGEHEATGGRQHPGIVRVIELANRFHLSGGHVDCCDLAA